MRLGIELIPGVPLDGCPIGLSQHTIRHRAVGYLIGVALRAHEGAGIKDVLEGNVVIDRVCPYCSISITVGRVSTSRIKYASDQLVVCPRVLESKRVT